MKINYIPDILKEKLLSLYKYSYATSLMIISIISAASLLTFSINDNSFLTRTSNVSGNLLGDFGSYYASFIFYTFGIFGYLIILFFLSFSILVFINKPPRYIFIRLLTFFLSLTLIPQALLYLEFNVKFIDTIEPWGIFANYIYEIYSLNYIHYLLSIFGVIIFLLSQNLFLLKFRDF